MTFEYSPCVGSGMCCKKAPCPYGEWNDDKSACKYLELYDEQNEIYRCGRYSYIIQQPGNEWIPAFGAGCCMTLFNSNRNKIITSIIKGEVNTLDSDIQDYFRNK